MSALRRSVEHDQSHRAAACASDPWHGSATTFGPLVKIAVTIALVLPPLLMGIALTYARSHPGNLFLVVPIAGFVMVDVQLLPALWEPARRRDR